MTVNKQIGTKALRLEKLKELGLRVPSFITVPYDDGREAQTIAQETVATLGVRRYAVRSSALVEDSDNASHAGQYLTKLDVPPEALASAIREVRESGPHMSLIIQEFIEPDCAGVTFTRSPLGGREMIIEWHRGRGDDVVGGKIQPGLIKLYWTSTTTPRTLPGLDAAISSFKKIEAAFEFPQDIEWCIKNDQWYFLQSRSITSLTAAQYAGMRFLDGTLPRGRPFQYAKTEISEFAPCPTPAMMTLLLQMYASHGPIARAYRRHGVRYTYRPFLVLIDRELYVDREEERRTLFPNVWTTIRNAAALARLPINRPDDRTLPKAATPAPSADEAIDRFLKTYETIFEINLLCAAAWKRNVKRDDWSSLRKNGRAIVETHLREISRHVGPLHAPPHDQRVFPPVLSDQLPKIQPDVPRGVSPGIAEGVLVSEQTFRGDVLMDEPIILSTTILGPDLASSLDRVSGIISERGGELSHLAILARERGVPVVVNAAPRVLGIRFGTRVRIDGSSGEIRQVLSE